MHNLQPIRVSAAHYLQQVGLPSTSQDAWRYTDMSQYKTYPYATQACHSPHTQVHLCGINGFITHTAPAPAGVWLGSLGDALAMYPELMASFIGSHKLHEQHAFAALNTAHFADCAVVLLFAHARVAEPIDIVWVQQGLQTCLPRTLILAAEDAQCLIRQTYQGIAPDTDAYNTHAVTEMVLEKHSKLDYVHIQNEAVHAYHTSILAAKLDTHAVLQHVACSLGAKLGRHEVHATLADKHAEVHISGLYMGNQTQVLDQVIHVEHAAPDTTSTQLFHGMLNDTALGIFTGHVHVLSHALKTNAKQMNKNLLLSKQATAYTRPQLEILADDVKCSHGATVGQIDADMLFYLQSRGIAAKEASMMLAYAFAQEIIDGISHVATKQVITQMVQNKLKAISYDI